jgi:hypothetical protein
MNEIEQLEKELHALRPKEPSADFQQRVEEALGDSARLAVRQLPELGDEPADQAVTHGNRFFLRSLSLLGVVALVALFLFFPSPKSETDPGIRTDVLEFPDPVALDFLPAADDSPINGVSTEELSGMSELGWEEPQVREILVDFFDEGIVERPGMSPARKYHYRYLDEIIWRNPGTNTFIRSSVPRQETFLIGLELF